MATLTLNEIAAILAPYAETTPALVEKLSVYLDLLVKWNGKTNLTAIRDPRQMVQRHFGESLFAAKHLPACKTLLDFGSGAGFPGIPMQLVHPEVQVTLGESQNKKAAFLREAVRTLGLSTEVWAARVDTMPVSRQFDVVALRAVDNPELALAEALVRVAAGGSVVQLTTGVGSGRGKTFPLPGSDSGAVEVVLA
ncbi:16S rRNA (guanine(527)-N(7))-methyltransferase RsmG [Granulicella sp. WH15]|uniref:16S rRNA (guanine(527)-N(7))-methyltransferase RsmG n=1 Tax=Granulicella sp. WH15 TaxID=2602070 RepID=UPI00136706AF|nr:16S rRNA (guanine(527)-N(7))-methyltransferase RsmG [Granulicella sp. WH15]QHN05237.1 16S rRNA (guanine(527)-N(7))-methyltransferase RsmG [Granulicella sp. WH15]